MRAKVCWQQPSALLTAQHQGAGAGLQGYRCSSAQSSLHLHGDAFGLGICGGGSQRPHFSFRKPWALSGMVLKAPSPDRPRQPHWVFVRNSISGPWPLSERQLQVGPAVPAEPRTRREVPGAGRRCVPGVREVGDLNVRLQAVWPGRRGGCCGSRPGRRPPPPPTSRLLRGVPSRL